MLKISNLKTQAVDSMAYDPALFEELAAAIEEASHLLPIQLPIAAFMHQNVLQAFEGQPFEDAVKRATHLYGAYPYLPEEKYREELRRGRIRFSELKQVLLQDLGDGANATVPGFGTRHDLRLAMLHDPLHSGPSEELAWFMAETKTLRKTRPEVSAVSRARLIAETRRWVMRDLRCGCESSPHDCSDQHIEAHSPQSFKDLFEQVGVQDLENWTDSDWEAFALQSLWRVCCEGVRYVPVFVPPPTLPVRHRDLLLKATAEDSDLLVNSLLIRFVAAFLDQGLAPTELPLRNDGFFRAFCGIYGQPLGAPDRWTRGLDVELRRLQKQRISPLESILESLDALGVQKGEWDDFLPATLLALKGWSGMVHQVEIRGDRAVRPVPEGSLTEFLAVRLLLDRFAASHVARTGLHFDGPLRELRDVAQGRVDPHWQPTVEQRAFQVFQLAQVVGLSPDLLSRLRPAEWSKIMHEIETFTPFERRRTFHLAYERRIAVQALDAVAIHSQEHWGRPKDVAFQITCCIDAREESFRRHLEEIAPNVETYGVAGFFNVVMYYRGAADAHFTPLCPIVVKPQHWVIEEVGDGFEVSHHRRAKTRRVLGAASHRIHRGTRTIGSGTLLTGALGVLASFPLVARILFPRLTARLRDLAGHIVEPPAQTHLHIERTEDSCGPNGGHIGFQVEEMITAGERLLRDMGLTSGFARLMFFLGHGSNSLNNPYNAAYNCGACAGSAGGPNARAMAGFLNDPRVRQGLAHRGIHVPAETVFVGCFHNTCDDSITYYDQSTIPISHREEFKRARRTLDAVCERNAHERCRRFLSAPLNLSLKDAREHVEERSEDLAQTRPELGNATNAITIVGRREWTRGLYLDRRAFLTSYDPTQDDEDSSVLTRILQAVFPVCSGISLQYYFSRVDNNGYGSGSKLPHNLASLLGVMDGASSDLRTGLPWQAVEIHEPVRSMFIIETTPEAMTAIMDSNEGIGRLARNRWIQLAVLHPETREISIFHDGTFVPYEPQSKTLPKATSSVDWYRGWRDHLEFSQIESNANRMGSPESRESLIETVRESASYAGY